MTEPVFSPGATLGWSVTKAPRFKIRKQDAISGRQLRIVDQPIPIWAWTLTWELLRDKNDARGTATVAAGFNELRTLMDFYLQRQGSFGTFLFDDPTDDSILNQNIGTGDGFTRVFQLTRQLFPGGFLEPITAPNVVSHVYLNSIDTPSSGNWSVDPLRGLLTFVLAPLIGTLINVDFTYYFRCHFADDTIEFENFMYQLWTLKQLKLESVLP